MSKPDRDDVYVKRIAQAASVDARSVVRVLANLPIKGKPGERIRQAMRDDEERTHRRRKDNGDS
jgi:predicted RNA-binding protein with RPS1 domain